MCTKGYVEIKKASSRAGRGFFFTIDLFKIYGIIEQIPINIPCSFLLSEFQMEVPVSRKISIPEERASLVGIVRMPRQFTKDGKFNSNFTLADLCAIKILTDTGLKKVWPLIGNFARKCENKRMGRKENFDGVCIYFFKKSNYRFVAVPMTIGWVLRPKNGTDRNVLGDLIFELWMLSKNKKKVKFQSLFKGKKKRLSLTFP